MKEVLKAVIVDDESTAREILHSYVIKYCDGVEIVGEADSVKTGIQVITSKQPDLVFLDIEMPYGNGFDLLEQLPSVNFEIIFITAFSNYALKALNMSAAYYILKPIDIDELVQSVQLVQDKKTNNNQLYHSKILLDNIQVEQKQQQRVVLPTMEGFEVVRIRDIIYCKANDNFTQLFLTDGRKLLICRSLKFYQDLFEEVDFCRIHKSNLINLQYVSKYLKGKGGQVEMSNNDVLEVSTSKKKEFLERF